jgi:hypothetical protein
MIVKMEANLYGTCKIVLAAKEWIPKVLKN